jgi:hypothetical protein
MNRDEIFSRHSLPDEPAEVVLSEAGRARRDAMLGELLGALAEMRRQRILRRRAAAGLCVALLIAAAAMVALSLERQPTVPSIGERNVKVVPAPTPAPLIVRVASDPGALERHRALPRRIVRRLGDDELLRALVAIDRPAGLIRLGDRVRLTAPVTDAELARFSHDS